MHKTITPSVSASLHIIRFILALSVVGGHWTQPSFQEGWPDRTKVAVFAVVCFFVLSGFTIRMITFGRPFQADRYFVDRLSRLWSVALPALLVTCLLDSVSLHINPAYYMSHWGPLLNDRPIVQQVLANAFFVSHLWNLHISPLSNSPFWSLAYEAWYYVLYALYVSKRYFFLLAAALIAGPSILFLMILWLLGVVTFDIFNRADTRRSLVMLGTFSFVLAAALWTIGAEYSGGIHRLYGVIQNGYFTALHASPGRAAFVYMLPGFIFAPLLLAILSVARLLDTRIQLPKAASDYSAAIGEFTFPLYLLHFPLLVLCGAAGFYDRHSALQKLCVFFGVCILIFAITPLTTRFKTWLRLKFIAVWQALRGAREAPQQEQL
jgi:peptidoglycan/LPS O-acetylase OafA/YrhL